MAQSFMKPENALKRAEDFLEVNKKQDALDVLHAAIQHKKWKNNWSQTIERIMMRHLELCVELKKMKLAREGLHQYRTTCQAANIKSLEDVVQAFRKAAEAKVTEAKKEQEDKMAELDDLDEMEAPQTIMLRAIQAHDTRPQNQDRDVHSHFRFLWDTYRTILDVLKSQARLEEVYHETAMHAFEFCRVNKRPGEFRRLCESLRKNWMDLGKKTGAMSQNQVNPNNGDTISRNIETRFAQMATATELDMWKEAYSSATEIEELMKKVKTKPQTRSRYLEYLGRIFWKGENYLFHAFACLKNVLYVKTAKKDLGKDDLRTMASKAVIAALCVPPQHSSDIHATLKLQEEGQSPYEKAQKYAKLFNAQSVPTRETIIGLLVEKNLLQHAAEPCQRLFALIESDFTPLSLCQEAEPWLNRIDDPEGDVCEGRLTHYVTPVKKIIFFRLMKQLSEVYANMTIENFGQAASIVPWSVAEKWMANAARQQGINIQINYREQAIVFGAARKVDMKSMRQPLIEIGYKLQQAMQRVAPEEQQRKEKEEKKMLASNAVRRCEEERSLIRQRREEIERRKEERERQKEKEEREAMEKIKKQEAKEAEIERKRQDDERKRREEEREEQRKQAAKLKETTEMLAMMKKGEEIKPSKLKIMGKSISDIQATDLEGISLNEIEKAREAQMARERQDKIRQRKLESKRVDHLARAMREEERDRLDDWADDIASLDDQFLSEAQERDAEEQRQRHSKQIAEKEMLIVFEEQKHEWVDERLESRYEEFEARRKEKRERLMKKEVDAKIERARARLKKYNDDQKKMAEDERRQEQERRDRAAEEKRKVEEARREAERKEEEEKRRAEEEERKRIEREERDAKRKEQEAKLNAQAERQRQREKEIEERLAGGGGGREDRRDDRRERDRDEGRDDRRDDRDWGRRDSGGDNWRRDRDDRRDGGDNWRRDDRRAPERDDRRAPERDDRRAPERDDRRAPEQERPAAAPWRRNSQPSQPRDDEDTWRKGNADPPRQQASRDTGDRNRDAEPEEPPRRQQGWGRPDAPRRVDPAPRRDPEPEAAAEPEADGFQEVSTKKKGKAKEQAAPEPQAAAQEDEDDGWETATKTKKKKKDQDKAPAEEEAPRSAWGKGAPRGGGDDGGKRPPWRSSKEDGDKDTKAGNIASSRSAWANKGKEDTPGDRPWRRNTGADADRWR